MNGNPPSAGTGMAKSPCPKLDPLFTDEVNEYGPLGNDTGADVMGHYRQWRDSGNRPGQFLPHLLRGIG